MNRSLSLLACAWIFPVTLSADIEFTKKHASYTAKPDETQFETVFTFKNDGKYPILIKKVDSNCGCISATTDKDRYEKGESGKVTAVFKIGSAEGVQTKSVMLMYAEEQPVVRPKIVDPNPSLGQDPLAFVETEPPRTEPEPIQPIIAPTQTERLMVELNVPALVQIEPKITKWDVGGTAETKTIQVTMDHDNPITIKDVRSSRENVRIETKEIEAGKRYEISVTPQSTEKVQLGMLTIETDCDIKKHRKKLAFFSIQRPEPKPVPPVVAPIPPANEDEENEIPDIADIPAEAAQSDQAPSEDEPSSS